MKNQLYRGAAISFVLLIPLLEISQAQSLVVPPEARQLVAIGLDSNLSLAQKRFSLAESKARTAESRGLFLPDISLSSRYSELDNVLDFGEIVNPVYSTLNQLTGQNQFPTNLELTTVRPFEAKAVVTQPIFNTNVYYSSAISKSLERASTAELAAAREGMIATILTACYQFNQATQQEKLLDSTVLLAQEALRVAERRLAAGNVTPEAVFAARADLAEVKQQAAESKRASSAAGERVNQLLHRPSGSPLMPLAIQPPFSQSEIGQLEDWMNRSSDRHEIAQLEELTEATARDVRRNKASIFPEIGAAFEVGYQGKTPASAFDDDPYWAASLSASWNLFSGGKRPARTRAAIAARNRTIAQRDAVKEQIQLQTKIAFEAARTAAQNVITSQERRVAAAENYRLALRQFGEGATPYITLLDARTRFTNAALNQILVGYSFEIALVELYAAAGQLSQEIQ